MEQIKFTQTDLDDLDRLCKKLAASKPIESKGKPQGNMIPVTYYIRVVENDGTETTYEVSFLTRMGLDGPVVEDPRIQPVKENY